MKRRTVGVILAGMLILSACEKSPETNIQNSEAQETISEDTQEDAEKKEEVRLQNYFVSITERDYPEKFQRILEWKEKNSSDNKTGKVMVPVISQSGTQDLNWFCDDICEWIEECIEKIPYEEAPWLYSEFIISIPSDEVSFELTPYLSDGYDRTAFYNALYEFLDTELTSSDYNEQKSYGRLEYVDIVGSGEAFDMDFTPDCFYRTADGITFGMVPVDRAAGSSYYMLVASVNDGKDKIIVNEDPYLGMGGQAAWIEFIDDSDLGFACLTYSGGDEGALYRTEDGGMSFTEINYPSGKIAVSDGTIYNPFVIPEKVWAEGDELYMLAGQSPYSGDYYNEELKEHPSGLYVSHNDGMSFEYVGEQ